VVTTVSSTHVSSTNHTSGGLQVTGHTDLGAVSSTNILSTGYIQSTFSGTALSLSGGPLQSTSSALFSLGSSTQLLANASGTYIAINTTNTFNGYYLAFQTNSSTKLSITSSTFAYQGTVSSTVSSTSLTFNNATGSTV